jgi:16S rRNA (cytosine967-C5)-methyltransferase
MARSRAGSPAPVDPVRQVAVDILNKVARGAFLDDQLAAGRQRLADPAQQSGRLQFLTTGATKWQLRLDHELNVRLPRGVESLPPHARSILRLALFELRVSDVPGYAAVNAAVTLARAHGMDRLTGLVNAVLRGAERDGEPDPPPDPLEALSVRTSHPAWLLKQVETEHGSEAAEQLAEWNNLPAPLWVRIDTSRSSPPAAREAIEAEGIAVTRDGPLPGYFQIEPGHAPDRLPGHAAGLLTVQDPSAGIAGLALDPREGQRIADLCAAPGGKATHLSELASAGCEIVATDSDPARYQRLLQTIGRHGGAGLSALPYQEAIAAGQRYDAILLDVPCTNLGVLRRRADARWRVSADEVARMSEVQFDLLRGASELLRPGGVLVYSTCTILEQENEMVVERFLEHHTGFARDALPDSVPDEFRSGMGGAASYPWRHFLDGAFVVRMKKRESI